MAYLKSALLHVPPRAWGPMCSAEEVKENLESVARCLSQPAQALEVLQQWLFDFGSAPQQRYARNHVAVEGREKDSFLDASEKQLTFRQIFLRSQTLDLAIESVVRSPDLKNHFREFLLSSLEGFSDEAPQVATFSNAFAKLLCALLGPVKLWMPLMKALINLEGRLVDEPCLKWLLQLIATLKSSWSNKSFSEQELEVEAAEEEACKQRVIVEEIPAVQPGLDTIAPALDRLRQWSEAAGAAYAAWMLPNDFVTTLLESSSFQTSDAQICKNSETSAGAIAKSASERVSALEAESSRLSLSMEDAQVTFRAETSELRNTLENTAVASQKVRCEIEAAEASRKELLRQVRAISETLDDLRLRCSEQVEQENDLRSELQQRDLDFSIKLSVYEKAQHRAEDARATAMIVADLALNIAADEGKLQTARLEMEVNRQKMKQLEYELALAEQEISRLSFAADVFEVCAPTGEQIEQNQAPILSKSETSGLLDVSICEMDRHKSNLENLCQALGQERSELADAGEAYAGVPDSVMRRAFELRAKLQQCLARYEEKARDIVSFQPSGVDQVTSDDRQEVSADASLPGAAMTSGTSNHDCHATQAPALDLSSALRPADDGRPSFLGSALVPSRAALVFTTSSLLIARSLTSPTSDSPLARCDDHCIRHTDETNDDSQPSNFPLDAEQQEDEIPENASASVQAPTQSLSPPAACVELASLSNDSVGDKTTAVDVIGTRSILKNNIQEREVSCVQTPQSLSSCTEGTQVKISSDGTCNMTANENGLAGHTMVGIGTQSHDMATVLRNSPSATPLPAGQTLRSSTLAAEVVRT